MDADDSFQRNLRTILDDAAQIRFTTGPLHSPLPEDCPICGRGTHSDGCGDFRPIYSPKQNKRRIGYVCPRGRKHIVVPLQIDPDEEQLLWYDLSHQPPSGNLAAHLAARPYSEHADHSPEKLDTLYTTLQAKVSTLVDERLDQHAAMVKERIIDRSIVPRTDLWQLLSKEFRRAGRIRDIEIFTTTSSCESTTKEWPFENETASATYNAEHTIPHTILEGSTIHFHDQQDRHNFLLRCNDRVLAIVRVKRSTDVSEEEFLTDIRRMELLSKAAADALDNRRRTHAKEIIDRIQPNFRTPIAKESECTLLKALEECTSVLTCDVAELILAPNSQPNEWLPIVLRHGLNNPQNHSPLPTKKINSSTLLGRVLRTKQTIVEANLSGDQIQVDCRGLEAFYEKEIIEAHTQFLHSIKSAIYVPIAITYDTIAVFCFYRRQPGFVYLGLVHCVEIVLDHLAPCLYVFQTPTPKSNSANTQGDLWETQPKYPAVSRDERQWLCETITREACESTNAIRAAVAILDENARELCILGPRDSEGTGGWPTMCFETRIPVERTDSAVARAVRDHKDYIIDDINEMSVSFFDPEGENCPAVSSANIRMVVGVQHIIGVLVVEWDQPNRASMFCERLRKLSESYAQRLHWADVHIDLSSISREMSKATSWEFFNPQLSSAMQRIPRLLGDGTYEIFLRNKDTGDYELAVRHASDPSNSLSTMTPDLEQRLLHGLVLHSPYSVYSGYERFGTDASGATSPTTRRQPNRVPHSESISPPFHAFNEYINAYGVSEYLQNRLDSAMFTPLRVVYGLQSSTRLSPVDLKVEVHPDFDSCGGIHGVLISTRTKSNNNDLHSRFNVVDAQNAESATAIIARSMELLTDQQFASTYSSLVDLCFSARHIAKLGDLVFDKLAEILGKFGAHLRLLDAPHTKQGDAIRFAYKRPPWLDGTKRDDFIVSVQQSTETDATGFVLREKKVFLDLDTRRRGSLCARHGTPQAFRDACGSVIVVPLIHDDEAIGSLHIYKSQEFGFNSAVVTYIISSIAPLLSRAIINSLTLGHHSLISRLKKDFQDVRALVEESFEDDLRWVINRSFLNSFFSKTAETLRDELGVTSVFAVASSKDSLILYQPASLEQGQTNTIDNVWEPVSLLDRRNSDFSQPGSANSASHYAPPVALLIDSQDPQVVETQNSILRKLVSDVILQKSESDDTGESNSVSDTNPLIRVVRSLKIDGRRFWFVINVKNPYPVLSQTVLKLESTWVELTEELTSVLEVWRTRLSKAQDEASEIAPLLMMGVGFSHFEHWLRSPLNIISMNCEAIKFFSGHPDFTPKQRQILEEPIDVIMGQIERLAPQYDKMIKSARLLNPTEFSPTDISIIIEDALHEHGDLQCIDSEKLRRFSLLRGKSSFDVEVEIERDLPFVSVSKAGVTMALSFIIGNAIEAIDALRERKIERPAIIRVTVGRDALMDDRISVSVFDQGIGMTEQQKQRASLPFNSSKGSSGLGLLSARYVMRIHGSDVHIESEQNSFTAVSFSLPIATNI